MSTSGALWGGPIATAATGQPTLEDIFDGVRSDLVGDATDTSVFSDTILQPYFNVAYRELWQTMAQVQTPRVFRRFYTVIPAYTTVLSPLAVGVSDFSEPGLIEERSGVSQITITTTLATTPIEVQTATPHGLGNNDDITIGIVAGTYAPWGRWFVTVVDASTLSLNGSVTDGNTGTGGAIITSSSRFSDVVALNYPTDRPLSGMLQDYMWEDGAFRFRGATSPAEIRVGYWASGAPPNNPTTYISIPDSAPYLQTRTAARAARSKGWFQMAGELNHDALGESNDPNMPGGLLRSFLSNQVRGLQRTLHRKPPFRDNTSGYPGSIVFW